jgi:Zn-dependent protease with chaperone function
MTDYFLILMGLVVLIIGVLIMSVSLGNRGYRKQPNYYTFFKIGTIGLPIGIIFYFTSKDLSLLAIGLVFFIAGLVNKNRWKNPGEEFQNSKKIIIGLVAATVLLILLSIIYAFMSI